MKKLSLLPLLIGGSLVALGGFSTTALAKKTSEEAIAEYREMLNDGFNPADLLGLEGEELWTTARGPKNATLEKCDLGKGPGVVKGASAELPRYFKDTGRVQDLESRLMTCMEKLQGIDPQKIIYGKWGKGERSVVEKLVAYIVAESKGMKVNVDLSNKHMKKMYALGKKTLYYRAGPMDFACTTCHGESGKRIRLQGLPDLRTQKGAAAGWGSWPAYRVSKGQLFTMQRRLESCYRLQRFPWPIYGSDVTIALSVYLAGNANGGTIITPALKR